VISLTPAGRWRRLVRVLVSRVPRGRARAARLLSRVWRTPFVDLVAPYDLGVYLTIDPRDAFQMEMWIGAYQPHVVAFLRNAVTPGARVLCAGLHVGYVAALARALAGPDGLVIAADPDPKAFECAVGNLRLGDSAALAPVHLFAGGLSDSDGELSLYRSAVLGHSSFAAPHQGTDVRTVPLVRGDHWLRALGVLELDVMVLDVEGWELHVLRGLSDVIARSGRLRALVEVSEWALREAGATRQALYDYWTERGFTMRWARQAYARAPLGVSGPPLAEIPDVDGDLVCERNGPG
jgi:FkbM family methyltransferase